MQQSSFDFGEFESVRIPGKKTPCKNIRRFCAKPNSLPSNNSSKWTGWGGEDRWWSKVRVKERERKKCFRVCVRDMCKVFFYSTAKRYEFLFIYALNSNWHFNLEFRVYFCFMRRPFIEIAALISLWAFKWKNALMCVWVRIHKIFAC